MCGVLKHSFPSRTTGVHYTIISNAKIIPNDAVQSTNISLGSLEAIPALWRLAELDELVEAEGNAVIIVVTLLVFWVTEVVAMLLAKETF